MVWNYRGYGESTGIPNPYNVKEDVEAVMQYLIKDLKVKGKIGVYGCSLGGMAACHLANKFPGKI